MATPRPGKPYVWVSHLAKLLGGGQCRWSLWFRARFKYDKYEPEATNLQEWNRDHARLMRDRRQELEDAGWHVTSEDQNAFKLEGTAALVAGKPDLVATMPGHALVIDGKTGRERESDRWQVLFYLYALPKARPDLLGDPTKSFAGEVQYQRGNRRVAVQPRALTPARLNDIVTLIKMVGDPTPPTKAPSRTECRFCNIGPRDCPERWAESRAAATPTVSDF